LDRNRAVNRLPDFSAASCTEPLLVLSTGHIIRRQYPHECFTLVISFCSLGLYLGSKLRSANRLPDFSAASCTEPLLVLSTGHIIRRQYPHECFTLVIPFCSLGLYLGSKLRSANRLPDFSAAPCTEPLLVLSTRPHHTQAIPVACYPPPTPTILGFGIAQC
jgi:hypothetical protein